LNAIVNWIFLGGIMAKKSNQIYQQHHNSYQPEYTEKVTRTEHFLLTKVFRHTAPPISKGFLRSLQYYCLVHEKEAVDLS